MSRRDDLLELLRPPAHRAPLIAAGAVLFTAGLLLEELRLDDRLPNGVHLVIVAAAAALLLGVALLSPLEGGRPSPSQSVLLVCGLLLLELAHVLGAAYPTSAAALTWTSLALAAVAVYPATRRNAAIATMITAVALGVAVLAAVQWLFEPSGPAVFRWVLLALSVAYVLASLALRGGSPRHAELLVVTAGLATLAIPVQSGAAAVALLGGAGPGGLLPGFWELVVLVAGCGLIAYGAIDRVPGAAWLGVAHLVAFLVAAGAGAGATLLWWPLILLALGGGVMAAGLRPRRPLPPEPPGYSVDRPLASRADDER